MSPTSWLRFQAAQKQPHYQPVYVNDIDLAEGRILPGRKCCICKTSPWVFFTTLNLMIFALMSYRQVLHIPGVNGLKTYCRSKTSSFAREVQAAMGLISSNRNAAPLNHLVQYHQTRFNQGLFGERTEYMGTPTNTTEDAWHSLAERLCALLLI